MRSRLLAGWKSFEPPTVHQKNVQPAVVVVIVKCNAAAGGFEQIFVFVLAAIDCFRVEAGRAPHTSTKVAPIELLDLVVFFASASNSAASGRASPSTSLKERTSAERLRDCRNVRREEDKREIPSRVWRLLQSAATFIVNGFSIRKFVDAV